MRMLKDFFGSLFVIATAFEKRIWLIAFIIFINVLGVGLILPLLPLYAEKVGASPITIGLFIATYPFFSLLAGPLLGFLSDVYGRKPVLLLSLMGTVFGFFLLGFATTLPLLFLARIVDGASAGNTSTAQAAIADITSKEVRTSKLGIIFAASSLGLILGPTMGILTRYGYAVPAYVASGIAAIGFFMTLFFFKETRNFAEQPPEGKTTILNIKDVFVVTRRRDIRGLLFAVFAIQFLVVLMWGTFALYGEHLFRFSGQQIGYISAFAALIGIAAQTGLLKGLLSIAREEVIVVVALLLMSAGLFTLGMANMVILILVGVGLIAGCFNIAMPVATGLISELSSEHEQGRVMGTVSSLVNLAALSAPIIGNTIYSLSMRGNYFAASAFGLLVAIFSMKLLGKFRRQPNATS